MFLENTVNRGRSAGWIEVVCGSMFSGKTEELIRRLKRAEFAKMNVEIFKPKLDVRYSEEEVVSHIGTSIRSTPVEHSSQILLLASTAEVIGIDVETIKENQKNSGGGQYLIKNSNCELWDKIYKDSIKLYDQMLNYQKRFPINPGQIQFWTAEMWALLWNLWMYGFETKITDEMSFSWATDDIKKYEQHPILHMAGVTDNLKTTKFYKGDYINIDPILKMRENPNHFDYINKDSSTIKYMENMKSYIQKYNI
jgi:hypothetical protein